MKRHWSSAYSDALAPTLERQKVSKAKIAWILWLELIQSKHDFFLPQSCTIACLSWCSWVSILTQFDYLWGQDDFSLSWQAESGWTQNVFQDDLQTILNFTSMLNDKIPRTVIEIAMKMIRKNIKATERGGPNFQKIQDPFPTISLSFPLSSFILYMSSLHPSGLKNWVGNFIFTNFWTHIVFSFVALWGLVLLLASYFLLSPQVLGIEPSTFILSYIFSTMNSKVNNSCVFTFLFVYILYLETRFC